LSSPWRVEESTTRALREALRAGREAVA